MRCVSPVTLKNPAKLRDSVCITVQCGKCGSCRANRRAEWSFRLKEEFKKATSAKFITLTYSNENLKYGSEEATLDKTDCQKFIKRLRHYQAQKTDQRIRYYMVGEYGSRTHRPHYHGIIFNIHNDIKLLEVWGLGQVHIGDVTDASIHYITKYHVNFRKGYDGKQDEFALMSKNPGIGHGYIERAGNWNEDHGKVYVMNNGYAQRMPRYYAEKIWTKGQRKRLAEKQVTESDKKYREEVLRLEKLGIKNPVAYMQTATYVAAQKIEHKAQKEDKL